MLKLKSKLPEFELQNQDGDPVKSSDFKSEFLAIYFYPKDNTPGCTTQGCLFRDLYEQLKDQGCEVVGISKDKVSSHKKFHQAHNFNFDILADTEKQVCEAFGTLREKSMFGKKYMGIVRSTFLFQKIDDDYVLVEKWEKANPLTDAKNVLQEVQKLNGK